VPRILDLLDKHAIKMTSFMIGDAVRRHPDVAAEIVRRGHEAGAHGRSWQRQYQLPRPQETEWIADSVHAIEQATGTRPSGYNNYWTAAETSRPAVLQDVRPTDDGEPHHIFITHSDRIAHNLRSVSADLRCRETLGVYRERRADRDVLRGAVLLDCACQDGWPG
jgi:peptidoglycan/xylan/chitin deacetylase (PgdA/CDA1 family)